MAVIEMVLRGGLMNNNLFIVPIVAAYVPSG